MFNIDKVVRNALGHGRPMLMKDKFGKNKSNINAKYGVVLVNDRFGTYFKWGTANKIASAYAGPNDNYSDKYKAYGVDVYDFDEYLTAFGNDIVLLKKAIRKVFVDTLHGAGIKLTGDEFERDREKKSKWMFDYKRIHPEEKFTGKEY
jgi:hypothetical protein